jgi:hypothetical protein
VRWKMSDLQMPFHAWENVVENLSLIRVDRTLLSNGGEPFSLGQSPQKAAEIPPKVASKYHGFVIYSRKIHKRIWKESLPNPVFRMN